MTNREIALIFPGQGAQSIGMGKELYDNFSEAKAVFEAAEASLPFNLRELCFEGPKEKLDVTIYTQPCLLTASIAMLEVLKGQGLKTPRFHAGLSLGEYSAVVASEIMPFEDAVKLVYNRGTFMENAVPDGKGTMAAIIGLDTKLIEEACVQASSEGIAQIANYNYSGQIVIGGSVEAVNIAMDICKEKGAKRVVPLSVSGPFHTSMLKNAADNLDSYLENIVFSPWTVPVVSNYTAKPYDEIANIKNLLVKQVISPVQWEKSVEYMISQGVDTFIEVGPGKTLSNFVKRIDKKVTILNVEDVKSLEKTLKTLEE
ncbi:ACP S-malonyltransferase [Alkalibacter saccharofermentans]|uniref:Malonyl CoA-acyl carrier protein transacylase n=1 Tax=Alkalibacter saccharofermentans DSM 14828 TaxID=1120975 RepID=A0A1M4VXW3_9FIRM|nr:ACP S-malonyltransferase [Alkalibacter saccharofermentans]SHE73552.1 [Acyl-carrier-protein] S-malonyltransferase [Alkalibacter saccharofermentans DSM 14828]